MNVMNTSDGATFRETNLLGAGFAELRKLGESCDALRDAIKTIEKLGDDNAVRRAGRLLRQIDSFEPSVTMIGQIKSGKTSLTNAFVGRPDLLPADVNPWTSVVTSLHLYPEQVDFEKNASFQFFDADEWDKLVSGGGRIGELASRAGADEELEKIKQQVAEMREKSRTRLGRKFEILLGQQHDYGYFDKELIERYVCLGEDLDENEKVMADAQGRFADITKAADLHMQRAALPHRLCIRDTPGVNDTFMMREQITIRSIRDSRICVVVLSAHQALSSSDMALIRLISHVKSRDVIIFVNRVDELSDPQAQVPQIERSILDTMKRQNGPKDVQVIFGSALWANCALSGDLSLLPLGSAKALREWQETAPRCEGANDLDLTDPLAHAWAVSGIPELQSAVANRICHGVGAAMLQRAAASGLNLANGIAATSQISQSAVTQSNETQLDSVAANNEINDIVATELASLQSEFDTILRDFSERLNRVQESFLERATASLIVHLEKFGEGSPWTYDPAGLRVLLSSSHKVLARKSTALFNKCTGTVSVRLADVYQRGLGLGPDDIRFAMPRAPQVAPPVSLGRTIALDLQGSWWKRWWVQRRGYKAYAESFHELIKSETSPFVEELRDDLAQGVRDEAVAVFEAFLKEQQSVFVSIDRMRQANSSELAAFIEKNAPREHSNMLARSLKTLNEYAEK